MATRPMSRVRAEPARNITTPASRSSGDSPARLSNESACTMSVVPTFAPSITASAGTSATKPRAANEATISPVAVLLCRTAVTPSAGERRLDRLSSALARKAPQLGAEGALHAALHHMDAPQQQRDGAGEIEEVQRRVHRPLRYCCQTPPSGADEIGPLSRVSTLRFARCSGARSFASSPSPRAPPPLGRRPRPPTSANGSAPAAGRRRARRRS